MPRVIDILIAALLLILLSPLALLLLLLTSPQPIYSHRRIGRNKKPFDCYKFRTMNNTIQLSLEQQAQLLATGKLVSDPRITRLGSFLRRTSIDELPQLYNVLRGDMSIVGPRPITEQELKRYSHDAQYYLSVRPGITGLWQVSGRSTLNYDQRIELDKKYVMEQSLMGDVRILLRTIVVVLTGRGAY